MNLLLRFCLLWAMFLLPAGPRAIGQQRYAFTNFVGQPGTPGMADGTGSDARFNAPVGIVADAAGSLFVADFSNHTIRKVTRKGAVTTFAGAAGQSGYVDGPAATARFNNPFYLALDSAGNLYVTDLLNHAVRKITPGGVVSTFAGGNGELNRPAGLAFDAADNLFVADTANHVIRLVTPRGLMVNFAGSPSARGAVDGTLDAVRFSFPSDLCVDAKGNIFIADAGSYSIRKLSADGVVSTIAGGTVGGGGADGTGRAARFVEPQGIRLTPDGNLVVGDTGAHTVRLVTPAGVVTTLGGLAGQAGTAVGVGDEARFSRPVGFQWDGTNGVFVVDAFNHRILYGAPTIGIPKPAAQAPPELKGR